MENIKDKFLRYVSIHTTSDPESTTAPSTERQFELINLLARELEELGIKVKTTPKGVLMASIPSNLPKNKKVKAVGFIAHVDTAPDASGENIKPQVISNYNGKDIILNKALKLKLSTKVFPELKEYKGQTIITTDGTTLLGADDKAGVAEIMCAAEYIACNKEFKHGPIKIAFTPDEEVGRGVENFSVKDFGADYAYTMDGGALGELEYENFNAASARIEIQGCNIHPGYAKGKMVNAIVLANEFMSLLPPKEKPEHTSKYQGFYHLVGISGTVEKARIDLIIRDHDTALFNTRKKLILKLEEKLNKKYGKGTFKATVKDQYYNMRKMVEPKFFVVEQAIKAMKIAGVKPKIQPIRGGTDGAMLSFRGLVCPNIFAGGHNFHGKLEYVPLESMQKATEVILNIISLAAQG